MTYYSATILLEPSIKDNTIETVKEILEHSLRHLFERQEIVSIEVHKVETAK